MLCFDCVSVDTESCGMGLTAAAPQLICVCLAALGHFLPKCPPSLGRSHKITLRVVGLQSIDFCSNRLSFSVDKWKAERKTYLFEISHE